MSKSSIFMQDKNGFVFETSFPEYNKECEILTRAQGEKLLKAQEIKNLKKHVKPGQTIYCVLRHVSGSGMNRRISFFRVDKKTGEIVCIDYAISIIAGYTRSKNAQGLNVSGCGMDMGFSVVHNLGYYLWPKGTPKPHGKRNGQPDSNGGYALKSAWL